MEPVRGDLVAARAQREEERPHGALREEVVQEQRLLRAVLDLRGQRDARPKWARSVRRARRARTGRPRVRDEGMSGQVGQEQRSEEQLVHCCNAVLG